MTVPERGPQAPIALAVQWVAKITTVALEMVLPGLAGQWLDGKLGTSFLVLLGFALGLSVGIWHLLQMTGVSGRAKSNPVGKQVPDHSKTSNNVPHDDNSDTQRNSDVP